jgi:hypothetical protein
MEATELRIRAGSKFLEGMLTVMGIVFLIFFLSSFTGTREKEIGARHSAVWVSLVALLVLRQWRWRRRILIGTAGIQWHHSKDDYGRRLTWSEVEELFILGPEEFELRGAGTSIQFTPAFGGVAEARERVSRSLGDLRYRLRDRAMREGELHFRMPGGRWKAHVLYLLVILVLTGLTATVALPIVSRRQAGFPLLLIGILGVSWVWNFRRRASLMGTVVTLYRDGLLVRRLDGSEKIAWSTVTGTDWNEKGGLDLLLAGGRRVSLPRQLANITLLEGFVEEARAGAQSA